MAWTGEDSPSHILMALSGSSQGSHQMLARPSLLACSPWNSMSMMAAHLVGGVMAWTGDDSPSHILMAITLCIFRRALLSD